MKTDTMAMTDVAPPSDEDLVRYSEMAKTTGRYVTVIHDPSGWWPTDVMDREEDSDCGEYYLIAPKPVRYIDRCRVGTNVTLERQWWGDVIQRVWKREEAEGGDQSLEP